MTKSKMLYRHASELLKDVKKLVVEKLFFYGNVHMGDGGRFMVTIDHRDDDGNVGRGQLQMELTIFVDEAISVFEPLLKRLGFREADSDDGDATFILRSNEILTEEESANVVERILKHAIRFDDAILEDFELSTLKHRHRLMPWEIHSFRYFDPPQEERG
jgi:hypothetical protein